MKKATFCAVIMTAFLFLGIRQVGFAQLLLTEDFDYAAGDLLTAHGWTAHSGSGTQPITVNSSGLSFPGYSSSAIGNAALLDNNGEDDSKTFAAPTSGSIYVGFMVKVITTSAGYFLHLGPNPIGTTFRGKVFMDGSNHFGVSVGNNTGTSATTTYNTGSTYMLVLKYEIISGTTNDLVSLFVFDTSLPSDEPSSPTIGPLSDAAVSDIIPATIALRQFSATQNILIDGIRVGSAWSDIVGVQVVAPTIQASFLTFNNVTGTALTNSWTNGNGNKRIVIISPNSTITPPTDGTDPVANSLYTGSGQQVVYNGNGSSIDVTGLTPSTPYWFKVFEYNGSGSNTKFCTASGTNNPMSQSTVFQVTAPQVTTSAATSITNNSAVLGGTIVSDGGSPITERGTVWSINSPVTINDNKLPEGGTATGVFSHLRSSLPAGTDLFYAAYAINGIGAALSPESSFSTLADEPSGQATNFGSTMQLSSTITLTWADNDGIQPATAYLVLANTTGTFTAPVDGVPQANDTILSDGSGRVNVLHGIQSYTWVGLNPSTAYYFVIYPYTNSGSTINYKTALTAPVSSATTSTAAVITYTWSGPTNGTWTTAGNWTPARTSPSATDILQFSDGTSKTITGIPSQTIGKLLLAGNTKVTLQSGGPVTLTIAGSAGTDLDVAAGCELNLGGANAVTLSVAPLATGSISGNMTFSAGAHRLVAGTTGAITFNSSSVFTASAGFTGSAFGTAAPYNAVLFADGSRYVCLAGSNPFGANAPNSLVTFQPGSLFKVMAGSTPEFSGRTYGNFELDAPGLTLSPVGTAAVSIRDLTITNGTLNFNMTGSPGHSVKGNIFVAPGAVLNFLPATAGTVSFSGTSGQSISGGGSVIFGVNSTLIISDPANIILNSSASIYGTLALSSGLLILTTGNISLGPNAIFTGTPSASSMIVATNSGQLRKEFPVSGGSFTFPVGNNSLTPEYLPVTLSFTGGVFGAGNWAGVNLVNAPYPVSPLAGSYIDRYWNISSGGITNYLCDATFSYISPDDVVGNEDQINCVLMTATPLVYNPANTTLHQLTATNLTSFGSFTGTQVDRTLNVTVFLEGLYSGGGTMSKARDATGDKFPGNTADQVTVELHSSVAGNYSSVVFSSGPVNLSTSGHINLLLPFIQSGSYYITIRHRNSIETVSAVPVSFSGYTMNYDFSDVASKAYGNNLKLTADGRYALYTGDVNQDGIVDAGDMIPLDNDAGNSLTGYLASDLNGDGFVNLADLSILENNANSFVSSRTP